MTKGFKLKREVVEPFEAICQKEGISQAAWLTEKMKEFMAEHNSNN